MTNSISVIIPIYNSAEILPELIERLNKSLISLTDQYEILLINDGSRDNAWQVIQSLSHTYPAIKGINLMRNYGQHNALLCGIRNAKNEYLVTMDDDLQHPPEEIYKLVEEINKGFCVVYGIPKKLVHKKWRNFFSKLTKNLLARFLGIKRINYLSAFRVMRRDVRKAFENFDSPSVVLDAMLTWGTENFGTVEVNEQPRSQGQSNYDFIKLVKYAMIILTGFSTIPLRISSLIGFTLTLFGIGVLVFTVVRAFIEGSVPGFPFLASIISIFSGAQLFSLGIIGEYLARIFNRSMNHPSYVIEETINEQLT